MSVDDALAWPAVLQVIGATALGVWVTQGIRLIWDKFGWGSRARRGR
jgi:hypothetical protein